MPMLFCFAYWTTSEFVVLMQIDDLAWCVMREIGKMCYNPQEEDVTRAKNQLKAAILFSQDNLSGTGSTLNICFFKLHELDCLA